MQRKLFLCSNTFVLELLDVWKMGRYAQASPGMISPVHAPRFINVTETGNYFIYSQVYFQIPAKDAKLNKKLTPDDQSYMIHFVFRQSGSTKSILLRSVVSNGFQGKRSGFFTSFTSGVHRLKKGDSLYVAVQKKLSILINTNDDSTFFGVFKLWLGHLASRATSAHSTCMKISIVSMDR